MYYIFFMNLLDVGMNWIANTRLNCQRAAWPREAAWIVLKLQNQNHTIQG
jgi:hypothetical protein